MKNTFIEEGKTKKALADFILRTDRLSMGAQCAGFEEKFAQYQGRKHAVLFNSGGSANLAMIQSLLNLNWIQKSDNVAYSALTWSTNTMPIIQMGLQPIALDSSTETLNVTSRHIEERLKEIPFKALFLTNVLGFAGDMQNMKRLCEDKGILLLEDNCESLGTELPEGKTGNFSLASSFSFYVAHHMSTIEGGMVCTDNDEYADMLKIVRANGWDRNLSAEQQQKWRSQFNVESEFKSKYTFYDLGYNLRPTEITGFLGQYQMQFLDATIKKREENYLWIEEAVKQNPDIVLLNHDHIQRLSTFAFPFIFKTETLKQQYLERFMSSGIEVRPIIAGNMQNQPFYDRYVKHTFSLPETDFIDQNGFYCGNYPELTQSELQTIRDCIQPR